MPSNQQYGFSIRRETSCFANWPPNALREIGDYGPVNGALFEFFGRLDREEIEALGRREGPSSADYDIMIKSSRSLYSHLSAEARANVSHGKALLEITFTSEEGIVFAAPSIKITEIASMATLGRILNERRLKGNWLMDHAVVVQVSAAESATILLSNQAGAGMEFEVAADAPVNTQLVAKLDAGVSLVSSRGVGIKIIGEGPLTPLFKLAYLQRRIVGDSRIAYRQALNLGTDDELDVHDVDDAYVLVVS
ncbi:hypothetical protein [Nonomuraea basaltis]|uniref:hypothetical protein n=1 Tax=Nonomuraea basaltis TaxID=2495887 RepID=UPI00110C615A|nr:hypothetical protein [Nonomuraea basaltis]TMR90163.1 hypothetical protein EJK15_56820 [Nonomuraea basaltis]